MAKTVVFILFILLEMAYYRRIYFICLINIDFIEKIEPYFGDRLSIRMKHVKQSMVTSAGVTSGFRKWLG